jgi:hypothetical protein
MRALVVGLSLAIVLIATPARAASFTLSSLNVNLNQGGLALNWTSLITGGVTFNLNNVGETFTTTLFQLSTKQSSLNLQSLVPHTINVGLNFTAPPPGFSGTSNGLTGAGWFLQSFGYVVWNNPAVMSFGTTGLIGVSLSNATFGLPGSTAISGTFKLLQNSSSAPVPSQVPEPASAWLFALGLGVLPLIRARRARV